jgi:hypothetical protein
MDRVRRQDASGNAAAKRQEVELTSSAVILHYSQSCNASRPSRRGHAIAPAVIALRILALRQYPRERGWRADRWNEKVRLCIYKVLGDIRSSSVDLVFALDYDAERRNIIGELFTTLDLIHVETKQALYAEANFTGTAPFLDSATLNWPTVMV